MVKKKKKKREFKNHIINVMLEMNAREGYYKVLVDLIDKCGMIYIFYNQYWNILKNIIISFEQFTLRDIVR